MSKKLKSEFPDHQNKPLPRQMEYKANCSEVDKDYNSKSNSPGLRGPTKSIGKNDVDFDSITITANNRGILSS